MAEAFVHCMSILSGEAAYVDVSVVSDWGDHIKGTLMRQAFSIELCLHNHWLSKEMKLRGEEV